MDFKALFNKFIALFKGEMKWFRIPYVVLCLLIVSLLFFKGTLPYYEASARDVKGAMIEKDSIIEKAIYAMPFEGPEAIQLKEQYEIAREIKDSHMMIAFHYTVYNYGFTIFFTVFSVITGILGFLLVKKGWDNTQNFYLRASFLLSFFFSSLFGIFPRVMSNEDNVKNNLSKYHLYTGIQMDLYTLAKDNKGYFERNTKASMDSLNREIIAITKSIKDNEDLYFDIKIDEVPSEVKPFEEQ